MRSAAVIVASTRAAAGVYQDRSGRIAADWFGSHGFEVEGPFVVADGEDVRAELERMTKRRDAISAQLNALRDVVAGFGEDDKE